MLAGMVVDDLLQALKNERQNQNMTLKHTKSLEMEPETFENSRKYFHCAQVIP